MKTETQHFLAKYDTTEHLNTLVKDTYPYARCRVASNLNVTKNHLDTLVKDTDPIVKDTAKQRLDNKDYKI